MKIQLNKYFFFGYVLIFLVNPYMLNQIILKLNELFDHIFDDAHEGTLERCRSKTKAQ